LGLSELKGFVQEYFGSEYYQPSEENYCRKSFQPLRKSLRVRVNL
jgi:hypothetical protein